MSHSAMAYSDEREGCVCVHGCMCACVDPSLLPIFSELGVSSMHVAHTRSPPDVIVFVISGDRSSFLLYHARGLKLRLITLRQ